MSAAVVIDIDSAEGAARAFERHRVPRPNLVVDTDRGAHAWYRLAVPVPRTEYARRAPLAYLAAVERGLTTHLDGDPAYSGLLARSPLGEGARAHEMWRDPPYSLDELRDLLGAKMPEPTKHRRRLAKVPGEAAATGRNVGLFESQRHEVYSLATSMRLRSGRDLPTRRDAEQLRTAIGEHLAAANLALFAQPLPTMEVHHMATSMWKWVTTNFHGWTRSLVVQEAARTTWLAPSNQAARGRRSGAVRREKRSTIADRVREELG